MSSTGRSLLPLGICLLLALSSGCGGSDSSGSTTGKLNTAPPLKPEVPEPVEHQPADPEKDATVDATSPDTAEATAIVAVDVPGMSFSAPADWVQKENPGINDAEFAIPGTGGDVRLTIMKAGGTAQQNIDRWKGQFRGEAGDEPKMSEIEVDGKTTSFVDLRGTYADMRPGKQPQENYRMLGFIIPFSASDNYFVKATGPQETLAEQEAVILKFVKSGKLK